MLCLIDGDILRYRIGFACETHYYDVYIKGDEHLGPVFTTEDAKERDFWVEQYIGSKDDTTIKERWIPDKIENCLHSVKVQLEFIFKRTEAKDYRIFLTGKGNFRDNLVDYYKANRKDARKPTYYQQITDYLIDYWDAEVVDGQEADDILGIIQYINFCQHRLIMEKDRQNDLKFKYWHKTVICTIDKDLDNVPGLHYNFVKDEKYWVSEKEAQLNFYMQLLTGDSTDNIPGLYKITGTRCSKKIKEGLTYCQTEKDMWEYVLYIYLTNCKKEHPEYILNEAFFTDKLKEIGQLLWIRHEENQMWKPPL